ncbi:MAG: Ycf66 family protein [Microcoleaceae cyanobacterium]
MLAYILAVAVAIGSFALYMAAFFFPEIHRKNDFVWSGVGLFYALILWVCAGRLTGAVLLGQTASVALLGWLGWQTVTLRRRVTPEGLKTPIPAAVEKRVNQVLPSQGSTLPAAVESSVQLEKSPVVSPVVSPSQPTELYDPQATVNPATQTTPPVNTTPSEVIGEVTEAAEELVEAATDKAEDVAETVTEWVETAVDKAEDMAETATDKAKEVAETVEDKIEETVAEVKAETKILTKARPTAKVKSKRQNPLSQLLGVVTGIFGRKPKPPQPISQAEMVKAEVPKVSPTPETEITPTAEVTPSETETVEITESEISNIETTETIATETEIETVEITEITDNEIASKSPFEELTSPTLEPQENIEKADLIELADAIDQADNPVVTTTSPAKVDVGEIEPTPSTVETVEIIEEPVELEAEVEMAEIIEESTEESTPTIDTTKEEVTLVEVPEETVAEADAETKTENQSDATPPSLKRPNPPKN